MAFIGTNAAVVWVNTTGTGTVRDSYNVSSVTNNATGDLTISFTNDLTDNDYAITGLLDNWEGTNNDSGGILTGYSNDCLAVGSCRLVTLRARFTWDTPQKQNFGNVTVACFR